MTYYEGWDYNKSLAMTVIKITKAIKEKKRIRFTLIRETLSFYRNQDSYGWEQKDAAIMGMQIHSIFVNLTVEMTPLKISNKFCSFSDMTVDLPKWIKEVHPNYKETLKASYRPLNMTRIMLGRIKNLEVIE